MGLPSSRNPCGEAEDCSALSLRAGLSQRYPKADVTPWRHATVEGAETFLVASSQLAFGVLVPAGTRTEVRGSEAFQWVRSKSLDADVLASYALLMLEGRSGPIARPGAQSGVGGVHLKDLAHIPVPSIDGPTLVYWRARTHRSGIERVVVDLEQSQVTVDYDAAVPLPASSPL